MIVILFVYVFNVLKVYCIVVVTNKISSSRVRECFGSVWVFLFPPSMSVLLAHSISSSLSEVGMYS